LWNVDQNALRKLVVAPPGSPDEVLDAAVEGKLASIRAMRRVEAAVVRRFGAESLGASAISHRLEEDLRAMESATVEEHGDTALIQLPGRRPLTLERHWGRWKVRLFDGISADAYARRMRATVDTANEAADHAVQQTESGACGDATCALAVFENGRFARPTKSPADHPAP
jgi:hypothetical protein